MDAMRATYTPGETIVPEGPALALPHVVAKWLNGDKFENAQVFIGRSVGVALTIPDERIGDGGKMPSLISIPSPALDVRSVTLARQDGERLRIVWDHTADEVTLTIDLFPSIGCD